MAPCIDKSCEPIEVEVAKEMRQAAVERLHQSGPWETAHPVVRLYWTQRARRVLAILARRMHELTD